jgi:4-cresol dehydrogenase (hydroxylating)
VFQEAAKELNLPFMGFQVPYCFIQRAFVYVLGFPITEDPAQNQAMRKSFARLIDIAAKEGWGEYRTPVAFQDKVMSTYSFNENALLRFHEKIKDAIDPNGVLSPGRYGIWPKHMRGK